MSTRQGCWRQAETMMVDVNTIKPGDKVVYNGKGSQPWTGEHLTVGDPTQYSYGSVVFVRMHDSDGALYICMPDFLDHEDGTTGRTASPDQSHSQCTCDSFKVLMVSGCRCGAMQREREANR
jgi:hypothetical protein